MKKVYMTKQSDIRKVLRDLEENCKKAVEYVAPGRAMSTEEHERQQEALQQVEKAVDTALVTLGVATEGEAHAAACAGGRECFGSVEGPSHEKAQQQERDLKHMTRSVDQAVANFAKAPAPDVLITGKELDLYAVAKAVQYLLAEVGKGRGAT